MQKLNDLAMTIDGDMVVDSKGDLKIARDDRQWEAASQDVLLRSLTERGDSIFPNLGAGLEVLTGEATTDEMESRARFMLRSALARFDRFTDSFVVRSKRLGVDGIALVVYIQDNGWNQIVPIRVNSESVGV